MRRKEQQAPANGAGSDRYNHVWGAKERAPSLDRAAEEAFDNEQIITVAHNESNDGQR